MMTRSKDRVQQTLLHIATLGMLAGAIGFMTVGCAGNKTAATPAPPPPAPVSAGSSGGAYSAELQAQQQNAQQQAQMMAQSDAHRAPMQQRKSQ